MEYEVRMIPVLLLRGNSFYKTIKFQNPSYIGDPINIVKIFNEKEIDELCILDIDATKNNQPIQFDYLRELADECFMPLSYGGGVKTLEDCRRLIGIGFEKVTVNSHIAVEPKLITEIAGVFGSQAVSASIDVVVNDAGVPEVWTRSATYNTKIHAVNYAKFVESLGAGEILLNAVQRDGTQEGYILPLIRMVADAVSIPVIACGGARDMDDLVAAVRRGKASAVAAGALFVYFGRRRAVLINPPTYGEFKAALAAAPSADGT